MGCRRKAFVDCKKNYKKMFEGGIVHGGMEGLRLFGKEHT